MTKELVMDRLRGALAAGLLALVGCPGAGEEPYPTACPDGEVVDIEDSDALGCVPRACGDGPWGDIERDGDTIHVAPWGDGVGSEDAPFGTLAEGVAEAVERGGGRVALAGGAYEGVRFDDARGIEVAGRCAELVTLSGASQDAPIVVVSNSEVTLRDLTVAGRGSGGLGVQGFQAEATVRDVVVRDLEPAEDAPVAVGIEVQTDAQLDARGVRVAGARGTGVRCADPASRMDLLDVVIEDTAEVGGSGWGLMVNAGCMTVAERITVRRNVEIGIFVVAGGRLLLTDSDVPDNLPNAAGEGGCGAVVTSNGVFSGEDVRFEGNQGVAAFFDGVGVSATLDGARIANTTAAPNGRLGGIGVVVQGGVFFQGTDVSIDDNGGHGMFVSGANVDADLSGVTIRGTRPTGGLETGRGLTVARGARVDASDLVIEDNTEVGLLVLSSDSEVHLDGGRVTGTTPGPTALATAVVVQGGGVLTAEGFVAEANDGPGIYVPTNGEVHLTDATLADNAFAGAVVLGGTLTMDGGSVTGTTVHPSEDGGAGVFVSGGTSEVALAGATFSDLVGPALYVRGPGDVTMTDCDVARAGSFPSLPGGVLAREGAGDGGSLVVEGTAFSELGGDAIVLDRAAVTLRESASGPNTFVGVDGAPLYAQCGDSGLLATVEDGSGADPACRESARPLGPSLDFSIRVQESGVIQ